MRSLSKIAFSFWIIAFVAVFSSSALSQTVETLEKIEELMFHPDFPRPKYRAETPIGCKAFHTDEGRNLSASKSQPKKAVVAPVFSYLSELNDGKPITRDRKMRLRLKDIVVECEDFEMTMNGISIYVSAIDNETTPTRISDAETLDVIENELLFRQVYAKERGRSFDKNRPYHLLSSVQPSEWQWLASSDLGYFSVRDKPTGNAIEPDKEREPFSYRFELCNPRNYIAKWITVPSLEFKRFDNACHSFFTLELRAETPIQKLSYSDPSKKSELCDTIVIASGKMEFSKGHSAKVGIVFAPKTFNGLPHCETTFFNKDNQFMGQLWLNSILGIIDALKAFE